MIFLNAVKFEIFMILFLFPPIDIRMVTWQMRFQLDILEIYFIEKFMIVK